MASIFSVLWTTLVISFLTAGVAGQSHILGDAVCSRTMCVRAFLNGTQWTYQMQANLGEHRFGWMAIGFGTSMTDSDMVIMWPNQDGFVTLSQRAARGHSQPYVVPNPPRVATKYLPLSAQTSTNTSLAFTIAPNGQTVQRLIWAIATTRPPSAAADASLTQHVASGAISLNLTREYSGGTLGGAVPTSPPGSGGTYLPPFPTQTSGSGLPEFELPALLPYQKALMAHAILSGIGFLIVLPTGALIGRWARTFTTSWFKAHWIVQAGLGIPIVFTGWFMAVVGIIKKEGRHFDDTHKVVGLVLIGAYTLQLLLGVHIHMFKPPKRPSPPSAKGDNIVQLVSTSNRPLLNYVHALLGLTIIALSFYQVWTGINVEWEIATGRGAAPPITMKFWIAWAAILPAFYLLGLALLPKQLRQERKLTQGKSRNSDAVPLKSGPNGPKKSIRGLKISNPVPAEEDEWKRDDGMDQHNGYEVMSEEGHAAHSLQPVQFARAL